MKGTTFIESLPPGYSPERDALILKAEFVPPVWVKVPMPVYKGVASSVYVMQHALQVGETFEDGLQVNVSPVAAQELADREWELVDLASKLCVWDRCLLPTTRIIDAAWLYAKAVGSALKPFTQLPSETREGMARAMLRASEHVTRATLELGITSDKVFGVNAGKHFPLTGKTQGKFTPKGVQRVANYGWFGGIHTSASGLKVWQQLGTSHDINFTDYSQVVWLVHRVMEITEPGRVEPERVYLDDVITDERLAGCVSSEGPLRSTRLFGTVRDILERDTEPPPAKTPSRQATEVMEALLIEAVKITPQTPSRAEVEFIPPPPKVPSMEIKTSLEIRAVWERLYGAEITMELRRGGSNGTLVQQIKAWQRYTGAQPDGDFGNITHGLTELTQKRFGLPVTGVVDSALVTAVGNELLKQEASAPLRNETIWIPAKNFTKAARKKGDVYWLIPHTMEAPEKPSTAEAVARWFGGANAPKASAHYCIDDDSIVRGVRTEDVAWAAPGANRYGIQYELAGYAKQSQSDWEDDFSVNMLRRAAGMLAEDSVHFDIPIRRVTVQQLKAARELYLAGKPVPREMWGVIGHHDTSVAFRLSTHYDPGPNFPWERFLADVSSRKRAILAGVV